ncbi:hypothetical protein COT78_01225 [Candidatus Berkelbacteria bacterium CG10_big_fil_rev_8_21_14_0_10_43_13]|uniref:Uncharacterized protein n=1 Tax=Candidatus Berkelbacteria bacterium CG10_big_fil_rev_8_21_14_0_10_43_13 TaxID=1974514 RepID=A0A2H0W6Y7_9BACT|nr:MAG: hypothetical protein COT78_01225 [Candidatus Berkelbacteria bacterium CG10_big_fil_rev_8_21_14_0_10_43_13]
MDLEKTLDSQAAGSASIPSSAPAPAPAPRPSGGNSGDDYLTEMADHGEFSISGLLLWLSAIIAISATVFFWFLNSSATQDLADKTSQKDDAVAEISSPTYAALETRANQFQSAVNQLSTASKSRFSMDNFLPLLYGQVNKNVVVTTLSVDDTGKVSFSGTTDSYKSAAQQVATLKNWKIDEKNVVTTATLDSESESVESGVVSVTFSISATVDKTTALSTASVSATEGGI